jgi:hypothetical protein
MIKYKDECKRKVRKHESEEKINLKWLVISRSWNSICINRMLVYSRCINLYHHTTTLNTCKPKSSTVSAPHSHPLKTCHHSHQGI